MVLIFCGENVAVTLAPAVLEIVNWQLAPVQAPVKPEKLFPACGVAVNETELPLANAAVQVVGQLIPAGLLVIVPCPVTVTVSCGVGVNVAETDWLLESES